MLLYLRVSNIDSRIQTILSSLQNATANALQHAPQQADSSRGSFTANASGNRDPAQPWQEDILSPATTLTSRIQAMTACSTARAARQHTASLATAELTGTRNDLTTENDDDSVSVMFDRSLQPVPVAWRIVNDNEDEGGEVVYDAWVANPLLEPVLQVAANYDIAGAGVDESNPSQLSICTEDMLLALRDSNTESHSNSQYTISESSNSQSSDDEVCMNVCSHTHSKDMLTYAVFSGH